jgi:ubiquinone/menaquinone biosynthesis C-methylase UbiE/uncharacterized protein YbaR (Trm112 family)
MLDFDHEILQCPVTKEDLIFIDKNNIPNYVFELESLQFNNENIDQGFINKSETYFYPVIEDIIILLPVYAFYIGNSKDLRDKMVFDKERVFKYYNEITFDIKNGKNIYKDSPKWVDYRDITKKYIRNSFTRAKKYLNPSGKYLLDIASGPIGLDEYLDLSENFEYRICADISFNALIQAKLNYTPKKGIYICADITNIPLKENSCDSVLCQHTLYHIPKNEQKTAVQEMYRVTKPKSNLVIVYSLFFHSFFMNITLLPIQIYRLVRHITGKIYVRLFNSRPRLYFYPHSLGWFRRSFEFGRNIEFYCWRSTNKYFLNLYIHKWFFGEKLMEKLRKSEEKYPEFWGRFGEYPVVLIKKEG